MTTEGYFPTIRLLAEYEVWCNTEAILAASQLNADQLHQRFPFGFSTTGEPAMGTIHETLFHTVLVFQRWGGCVGPSIGCPPERDYDPAMTMDSLALWNSDVSTTFMQAIDAPCGRHSASRSADRTGFSPDHPRHAPPHAVHQHAATARQGTAV